MRSFLSLSLTLSFALGAFVEAQSLHSQAIRYGRSEEALVDARDVQAALEVLRRANYNFDDHLLKRSGSYTYKSKGDVCYCKPEHPSHHHHTTSTKKHHSSPTHHEPHGGDHHPKPTHTTTTSDGWHGGKHHHHPTASKSSSWVLPPSKPTGKPSCPSGYKCASKGDTFVYSDNDLVDAKNLDIDIDILNFANPTASPVSTSKPAKEHPKCEDEYCCYKPVPGKGSPSSPGKATCPSGYTSYGKGDTIIKSDNDLIDLKDLSITLNILSFASPTATPVSTSTSPKDSSNKCDATTCCVKQTTKKGDVIVKNDDDVIDAKGATVKVCILSLCI